MLTQIKMPWNNMKYFTHTLIRMTYNTNRSDNKDKFPDVHIILESGANIQPSWNRWLV